MIESFTIKNYRCYRKGTELSFIASKKEGGKKFGFTTCMVQGNKWEAHFAHAFVCRFKWNWKI